VSAQRRIIPVSSGKGGVGKTTVAVNYALSLSLQDRTILVDVDTGTSSVRNVIDTPVERDLYHFFKKGHSLADCVTSLSPKLDPEGRFRNFGFIASPRHLIEDITNFTPQRREQLIDAINELPARYVVLDLKAGADANVVEFLPFTNSGILVFTPHLPAATLAASDIVKAILFRKLRTIFASGSPIYAGLRGIDHRFVNSLIDRVEDVYDDSVQNLDGFVVDLYHALGEHPVIKLVVNAVDSFHVHYVLNMFNGVKQSYETAVKPFVQNLVGNVSGHLTILNLGWVIAHADINQANIQRTPVLLTPAPPPPAEAPRDRTQVELSRLATQYLGLKPPAFRKQGPPREMIAPRPAAADASRYLDTQLEILKRMYDDMKDAGYRQNFRYITYRSLHVMSSRGARDFGDARIFKQSDILAMLARKASGPR
jgi:MinD-like ATPase involved in chromosome partitioning or flagellar assembly